MILESPMANGTAKPAIKIRQGLSGRQVKALERKEAKRMAGIMPTRCPKCGEEKPFNDFPRMFRKGAINYHEFCCRKCTKARHARIVRQWADDNAERMTEYRHDHRLKKTYGISLEEFNRISTSQNNLCVICGKKAKLYVDHCHKSGRLRKLICFHCNTGLGHFRDDPKILTAAIDYLARHSTSIAPDNAVASLIPPPGSFPSASAL